RRAAPAVAAGQPGTAVLVRPAAAGPAALRATRTAPLAGAALPAVRATPVGAALREVERAAQVRVRAADLRLVRATATAVARRAAARRVVARRLVFQEDAAERRHGELAGEQRGRRHTGFGGVPEQLLRLAAVGPGPDLV